MKQSKSIITLFILFLFLAPSFANCGDNNKYRNKKEGTLLIGWSSVDITPDKPILIWGQRSARVSEGVLDPATVLAIKSGKGISSNKVILVNCDLVAILDGVREPDMYFTPETENNLYEFRTLIRVPERGVYNSYTTSDDDSQIYLDNQLIVDRPFSSIARVTNKVALEKEFHKLKILFYKTSWGTIPGNRFLE